jgi:hypothetical protein
MNDEPEFMNIVKGGKGNGSKGGYQEREIT